MEKANKILKPIVIVMGVLIVAMIALIITMAVVGKKGVSGSVKTNGSSDTEAATETQEESEKSEYKFDKFDAKYDVNVSTQASTETQTPGTTGDYLLPNSQTTALTATDLQGFTAEQLYYAKAEIYARHGATFTDAKLNAYFATKSWYHADASVTNESLQTAMSDVEKNNCTFIDTYATANNLTYTPQ